MNQYKTLTLILLFLSGVFLSCGQISQKDQRAKLQFLYLMMTHASLANEFTFRIHYSKDLDTYKIRLKKIQSDIENIPNVDSWNRSSTLKDELNGILQNNINISDSILINKNISEDMKIDYLPEIVMMKNDLDRFLFDLDVIISETDKE